MTYQDRNNVVSIIVAILVNGYVISRLIEMNATGLFDGPDAPNVWARMIIWVIPISIAATIIGTILFNIGYAIVTGTEKPSFVVDERDRLFEQRSMIAVMILVVIGFFGMVIGLAIGWSALVAINILYFAFAAGSIAGDAVKFISYRRGY